MSNNDEQANCFDCKYKVGIGLALRTCRKINYIDIDENKIIDDYKNRILSPQEIMDYLHDKTKKGSKEEEDIVTLKRLMQLNEQRIILSEQ